MPNFLISVPSRDLHFVEQTLEFHEEIGVLSTIRDKPPEIVVAPDRSLSCAQIATGREETFLAFLEGIRRLGIDVEVVST